MQKILITTSTFGKENPVPLEMLSAAGLKYVLNPFGRKISEEELQSLLVEHRPEYFIAGTEKISRSTLELAKSFLKMISRCGTGIDNVDITAAQALGIPVASTPDAPTTAVAELTIGVMLDVLRRISCSDRLVRAGKFDKYMGNLLSNKTLGIIGCGRIGTMVAKFASAFDCAIIGYDSYIQQHQNIKIKPLDEVLSTADIISLHMPFAKENRHIINHTAIEKMKPSALLFNISRGGLVDEDTLISALRNKRIAGAGIDCFEAEPYAGELKQFDNVVLTPHIGSYASEARLKQEIDSVQNILDALHG
jgi:D-3-phosphoglycerate dehydrogenase